MNLHLRWVLLWSTGLDSVKAGWLYGGFVSVQQKYSSLLAQRRVHLALDTDAIKTTQMQNDFCPGFVHCDTV
jgi:hypothetical protein